jgi:hypothetical protein
MYEWFADELRRIRWPGFHRLAPCPNLDALDPRLPPSYVAFIHEFGAGNLYLRDGYYQMGVKCPPEPIQTSEGECFVVGYTESIDVVFIASELAIGIEARLYDLIDGVPEEVAFDFASWLEISANDVREEYSKEEWLQLERGPTPFDESELAIVKARRAFTSELLGAGRGPHDLRVRIRNGSDRVLPWLTVGVRHREGVVQGGVPIDVSSIRPGEEKLVDVPGYLTLEPEDAVLIDLPEPTPATRNEYSELATSGPMKR